MKSEENIRLQKGINEDKTGTIFTPETIKNIQTLGIKVLTDLSPTLKGLNDALGTSMQPRSEGYHLTIIAPGERDIFQIFDEENISQLQQICESIQSGKGFEITGVGYINGAVEKNIDEEDKLKRTSYVALEIPALHNFRKKLGLLHRDLHITLGFEKGDIHLRMVSQDDEGNVYEYISKKANPDLARYTPEKIEFGPISYRQRI